MILATIAVMTAERHIKGAGECRQGAALVLVARHEILTFTFQCIRDVDRPAREELAVLQRQRDNEVTGP